MDDIRDLQYLFLHFDVLEILRSNSNHIAELILAHPDCGQALIQSQGHLLIIIRQLEEQ